MSAVEDDKIKKIKSTMTATSLDIKSIPVDIDPNSDIELIYGKIPLTSWLIILSGFCERMAYFWIQVVFIPYMVNNLGLSSSEASAITRGFNFVAYFTVVLGAVASDGFLGKFRTISYSSIIYACGLIILAATSSPAGVSAGVGKLGFIISMYLFVAFGMGGFRANLSSFCAVQINEENIPTGIKPNQYYGYNLTVERIFRYLYWGLNIGPLISQIASPLIIQKLDNFGIVFGIPTIIFGVGISIFLLGRSKYQDIPIVSNPFKKAYHCIKYALNNRNSNLEHWLDAAKVEKGEGVNWDFNFVEDLKRTLRSLIVFCFLVVYYALYYNMFDTFIIQGMHMKRPSWLSSEQLNVITTISVVIYIPIFDNLVFPLLTKFGIKLGPLRRISIGFFICSLAMAFCAILQSQVYATGPYYDFSEIDFSKDSKLLSTLQNDISIWWQIPVYLTMVLSEIFAAISGMEFFFKSTGKELKTLGLALFFLTNSIGSLLGLVFSPWSKDPYFTILFGSEASVMFVLSLIFCWFFFNKDDKE